ncbi:MAG: hypothetical protein ABJQ80_00975 [Lentilitoribacter sp.]
MNCDWIWNEYELLYTTYESFNGYSLTLKSWSVTVGLAAVIAVYVEKLGNLGTIVLWTAAWSTVPFWLLDAVWKSYQRAYIPRLEYLESLKGCSAENLHNFGIVESWDATHGYFDWIMEIPFSAFPHVFILAISVYLVTKHPPTHSK